jgi:hypothetical protein
MEEWDFDFLSIFERTIELPGKKDTLFRRGYIRRINEMADVNEMR